MFVHICAKPADYRDSGVRLILAIIKDNLLLMVNIVAFVYYNKEMKEKMRENERKNNLLSLGWCDQNNH